MDTTSRVHRGAFINCDDVVVGQESDGSHSRHPIHPRSADTLTGDVEEKRERASVWTVVPAPKPG